MNSQLFSIGLERPSNLGKVPLSLKLLAKNNNRDVPVRLPRHFAHLLQ